VTLKGLQERVVINTRQVQGHQKQIDQGFLGKFEVGAQLALEDAERKLVECRTQLREQVGAMILSARVLDVKVSS
jgi:hypothetical protein